jgi:chemotaxis protein MotA
MDIATIVGVILGMLLIIAAILLGGSVSAYIDIPSVVMVIGGGIAATAASFPVAHLLKFPKVFAQTLKTEKTDPRTLIKDMVRFAEVARRDGILALESLTGEMKDPLLVTGVKMAIDGTDPDLIQQIMDQDLENTLSRHAAGKGMLDALGRYAPAFGMIGTLVGLVAMLANMQDPSSIGAGMAVALLTTLYGAVMANVFCLPLADKLAFRNEQEYLLKSIIIKGVMSIQSGDNPRVVEQKLKTFLPPALRGSGEGEQPGGSGMKRAA